MRVHLMPLVCVVALVAGCAATGNPTQQQTQRTESVANTKDGLHVAVRTLINLHNLKAVDDATYEEVKQGLIAAYAAADRLELAANANRGPDASDALAIVDALAKFATATKITK